MYKKLKTALFANDIDYKYLKGKIGRSAKYISARMTGKLQWNMNDVYNLCDLLNIPYAEISEYFPKGGMDHA